MALLYVFSFFDTYKDIRNTIIIIYTDGKSVGNKLRLFLKRNEKTELEKISSLKLQHTDLEKNFKQSLKGMKTRSGGWSKKNRIFKLIELK
jgi:ribonuclease HI